MNKLKKWFENFWYYYKYHTIIVTFVVVCLAVILTSYSGKQSYDLQCSFVGSVKLQLHSSDNISSKISEYIDDTDNNDRKNVYVYDLTTPTAPTIEDATYLQQLSYKISLEFTNGETYLFFTDGEYAKAYGTEEYMHDLSELTGKKSSYAVSVEGNSLLESCGINTHNLFMCVKLVREFEKDNKELSAYNSNARKAAAAILKYNPED